MLTDTTSCVRTNFGDTRTFRTRVGIIQGSVLAASLFAVYISPISDELVSLSSVFNNILFPPQLYADDMEALARRLLQAEQLSRAAIQWSSKWGSEVGITKSNLVLIMANLAAPTTPAPPLTLKAVNSTDILGVKLSKEGLAPCNFVAPQISKLHKKIQAVFAAIGGLSTTVKPIIAVYLYQTYAFSSMKHILPLAAHNSKTLTALQAAQNTFTQRTLQSDSSSSYILLDAELGLIDIDIQASKERILMFYRALKNPQDTLAPAILSFPTRENGVTAQQELQNLISFLGINIALPDLVNRDKFSVKYILQQGALNTQKKRWMETRDISPPESHMHFRIKSQWGLDPILSSLSAAHFATVIKARLGGTTWSHNKGPHCQRCSYPNATTEHHIWHCPAHLRLRCNLRAAVSEALTQDQLVNLGNLDLPQLTEVLLGADHISLPTNQRTSLICLMANYLAHIC